MGDQKDLGLGIGLPESLAGFWHSLAGHCCRHDCFRKALSARTKPRDLSEHRLRPFVPYRYPTAVLPTENRCWVRGKSSSWSARRHQPFSPAPLGHRSCGLLCNLPKQLQFRPSNSLARARCSGSGEMCDTMEAWFQDPRPETRVAPPLPDNFYFVSKIFLEIVQSEVFYFFFGFVCFEINPPAHPPTPGGPGPFSTGLFLRRFSEFISRTQPLIRVRPTPLPPLRSWLGSHGASHCHRSAIVL